MSENNELVQYSKYLDRRLAKLERQESDGYSKSEADAKFVDWVYAFDNFLDIGAYADFVLTSGQATGATLFPQVFSLGVVSNTIWGSGAANGDLILEGTSDVTKTSSYVILQPTGGNVGIGTSTPASNAALTISRSGANMGIRLENASGGPMVQISDTVDFASYIGINATSNYLWFGQDYTNQDDLVISSGGNVGIGTASPLWRLHVEQSSASDLNVAYFGNPNSDNAARSASIVLATSVYSHTYLRQNGGSGTQTFGGAVDTILMNNWTANDNGHLHFGTNNTIQMTVSHSGNVGIGTTTPTLAKLQINGTSGANGIRLESGRYSMNGSDTFAIDAVGTAGGRFYVDASGNVGIGNNSPGQKLDVNGTGKFGAYCLIGTSVTAGYYQDVANGAYRAITTTGTGGYYFQSNSGTLTAMYIGLYGTYAGRVGIGTSAPDQALDVNGKIKLRGDQLIFEGGSGLGADQGDATATLYNRAGVGPTFSGLQVVFRTGATPAERVRIDSSGNVGIGTNNPGTKLHVENGDVLLSNNRWYYGRNSSGTLIRLAGVDTGNNVYMGAIDNAGGKVIIREDGSDTITLTGQSVGINTSSPDARLDVQVNSGQGINVLEVKQEDTNMGFINFNSTDIGSSGTHLVNTAAVGTYYGKIKIAVNGTYRYIPVYNS